MTKIIIFQRGKHEVLYESLAENSRDAALISGFVCVHPGCRIFAWGLMMPYNMSRSVREVVCDLIIQNREYSDRTWDCSDLN